VMENNLFALAEPDYFIHLIQGIAGLSFQKTVRFIRFVSRMIRPQSPQEKIRLSGFISINKKPEIDSGFYIVYQKSINTNAFYFVLH